MRFCHNYLIIVGRADREARQAFRFDCSFHTQVGPGAGRAYTRHHSTFRMKCRAAMNP